MTDQSPIKPFDYRKAPQYDRAADDWYVDPPFCTELLIEAEDFTGQCWDPCCGRGTIPWVLRAAGIGCHASDLRDRGGGFVHNFLTDKPLESIDHIVMNPPYGKAKLAVAFIERARQIAHCKVAALVSEKFLYSEGRHQLFSAGGLYRVYFLSSRPSMPPGEMLEAGQIEAKGGAVNYCWLVFLRGYAGAPTCHWLIKPEAA